MSRKNLHYYENDKGFIEVNGDYEEIIRENDGFVELVLMRKDFSGEVFYSKEFPIEGSFNVSLYFPSYNGEALATSLIAENPVRIKFVGVGMLKKLGIEVA